MKLSDKKNSNQIAHPRQELFCVAFMYWCVPKLIKDMIRTTTLLTAGSDDRVPRRPDLMQLRFDWTPDPDP